MDKVDSFNNKYIYLVLLLTKNFDKTIINIR